MPKSVALLLKTSLKVIPIWLKSTAASWLGLKRRTSVLVSAQEKRLMIDLCSISSQISMMDIQLSLAAKRSRTILSRLLRVSTNNMWLPILSWLYSLLSNSFGSVSEWSCTVEPNGAKSWWKILKRTLSLSSTKINTLQRHRSLNKIHRRQVLSIWMIKVWLRLINLKRSINYSKMRKHRHLINQRKELKLVSHQLISIWLVTMLLVKQ